MCGRFRSVRDIERLAEEFGMLEPLNFPFNPNVAPTDAVPIVTSQSKGKKLELARFGLMPSWAKGKKLSMINTRLETARNKPSFRTAFERRRCVIPAEGFYEWREERGKKQPYFFSRSDGKPILLAGIWEFAEIEAEKVFSFSILTDGPNALVATFHDRMPLILDHSKRWLDLDQDPLETLRPLPPEAFSVRPMNPAMNRPAVKDLALIEP